MKKLALFFVSVGVALSGTARAACTIHFDTYDTAVGVAINSGGWDFAGYDAFCEALASAHAGLWITGKSNVVADRLVAFATIQVADRTLPLSTGAFGGQSIRVAGIGSQTESHLLRSAIMDSVTETSLPEALIALEKARQALRKQN